MSRLPGIIAAKASYPDGNVVVQYDPSSVSPAQIADAIVAETYFTVGEPVVGGELAERGEVVQGSTAVIRVEGMSDERTASLVTQSMGAVGPAISGVSLDAARSTLTVSYDPEQVSAEALVDAIIRGSGLQASLLSTGSAGGDGGGAGSTDYTPYVVLGIAGLFVAALAWSGLAWGRRQLARPAPSRMARRRRDRSRPR